MKRARPPGDREQGRRRSKFEPDRQRSPLSLQPRDILIVQAVYECRFLSRAQIQRLFNFHCVTRANIRLRKLFDHGYLSRRFLPTVKGSGVAVYCLGSKGIPLIAEHLDFDEQLVKSKRRDALEVKDFFLTHDLLVNDVRIATVLACRNNPELQFVQWIDQRECGLAVGTRATQNQGRVFSPDGYCQYRYQGKLYAFFLELDRSTMSSKRFLTKVQNYLEFGLSGSYREQFGLNFFRVFVVTLTRERLFNLKAAVERITSKMFWFAIAPEVLPDRLFGRVWHRAGQSSLFSPLEG